LKGTDRGLFEGTLSPYPGGEIEGNHRKTAWYSKWGLLKCERSITHTWAVSSDGRQAWM